MNNNLRFRFSQCSTLTCTTGSIYCCVVHIFCTTKINKINYYGHISPDLLLAISIVYLPFEVAGETIESMEVLTAAPWMFLICLPEVQMLLVVKGFLKPQITVLFRSVFFNLF